MKDICAPAEKKKCNQCHVGDPFQPHCFIVWDGAKVLGRSCQQCVKTVLVWHCSLTAFKHRHQNLGGTCLWFVPDAMSSRCLRSLFEWYSFFIRWTENALSAVSHKMTKRSYGYNQFLCMKMFVFSLSRTINTNIRGVSVF